MTDKITSAECFPECDHDFSVPFESDGMAGYSCSKCGLDDITYWCWFADYELLEKKRSCQHNNWSPLTDRCLDCGKSGTERKLEE
jgi:hypothetical protein